VVAGEDCAKPGVKRLVTPLALGGGEIGGIGGVRGIGGLLPILEVAGLTICREAVEDSDGGLLVAFFARNRSVGTEQREAVHVILHLLHGDVPTLDGMAQFAIRTHLPAMHIGVAVGAVFAHVGEDRFYVASVALYFFMHAAQRIFGFVVIEFGNRANWPPARSGVTVFAGNVQPGAVRTARCLFLGLL